MDFGSFANAELPVLKKSASIPLDFHDYLTDCDVEKRIESSNSVNFSDLSTIDMNRMVNNNQFHRSIRKHDDSLSSYPSDMNEHFTSDDFKTLRFEDILRSTFEEYDALFRGVSRLSSQRCLSCKLDGIQHYQDIMFNERTDDDDPLSNEYSRFCQLSQKSNRLRGRIASCPSRSSWP
jgi:hypothetical protein